MTHEELIALNVKDLKVYAKSLGINPAQKPNVLITKILEAEVALKEPIIDPIIPTEDKGPEQNTTHFNLQEPILIGITNKLDRIDFLTYVHEAFNSKLLTPLNVSYEEYLKSEITNDLDELSAWLMTKRK